MLTCSQFSVTPQEADLIYPDPLGCYRVGDLKFYSKLDAIDAMQKTKIHLQFPVNWLEQAPLTHADLLLEADYLKSAGFKLDFI